MGRLARSTLALVALACLVPLAACTGAGPRPVPLSRAEKIALYERVTASYWLAMLAEHPAAIRPDLNVVTVSSGRTWAGLMAACLGKAGIPGVHVSTDGGIGFDLAYDAGGIVDVPLFGCEAEYPRTEDLARYLSDSQLGSLYDYYVDFLQPCLLMNAGTRIGPTPTRAAFVRGYYSDLWSPYNGMTLQPFTTDPTTGHLVLTDLGKRCPPSPPWLPGG